MSLRTTHTYALLEVSKAAFEEIDKKLRDAGHDHAFDSGHIDMAGIALVMEPQAEPAPRCQSSYLGMPCPSAALPGKPLCWVHGGDLVPCVVDNSYVITKEEVAQLGLDFASQITHAPSASVYDKVVGEMQAKILDDMEREDAEAALHSVADLVPECGNLPRHRYDPARMCCVYDADSPVHQ